MPDFRIYKSEFAVRAENDQLSRENTKLKAEVMRLKQMIGEPVTEAEIQKLVLPAPGETFTSGNCAVTISAPKGNSGAPPALNPMIAARRAKGGKAIQLGADLPQSTQPRDLAQATQAQDQPQAQQVGAGNVDNDDTATRFSLVELR